MPRCLCGTCRYCRNRAAGKRFYDRNRERIIRQNVAERRERIASNRLNNEQQSERHRTDEQLDSEALDWLNRL